MPRRRRITSVPWCGKHEAKAPPPTRGRSFLCVRAGRPAGSGAGMAIRSHFSCPAHRPDLCQPMVPVQIKPVFVPAFQGALRVQTARCLLLTPVVKHLIGCPVPRRPPLHGVRLRLPVHLRLNRSHKATAHRFHGKRGPFPGHNPHGLRPGPVALVGSRHGPVMVRAVVKPVLSALPQGRPRVHQNLRPSQAGRKFPQNLLLIVGCCQQRELFRHGPGGRGHQHGFYPVRSQPFSLGQQKSG